MNWNSRQWSEQTKNKRPKQAEKKETERTRRRRMKRSHKNCIFVNCVAKANRQQSVFCASESTRIVYRPILFSFFSFVVSLLSVSRQAKGSTAFALGVRVFHSCQSRAISNAFTFSANKKNMIFFLLLNLIFTPNFIVHQSVCGFELGIRWQILNSVIRFVSFPRVVFSRRCVRFCSLPLDNRRNNRRQLNDFHCLLISINCCRHLIAIRLDTALLMPIQISHHRLTAVQSLLRINNKKNAVFDSNQFQFMQCDLWPSQTTTIYVFIWSELKFHLLLDHLWEYRKFDLPVGRTQCVSHLSHWEKIIIFHLLSTNEQFRAYDVKNSDVQCIADASAIALCCCCCWIVASLVHLVTIKCTRFRVQI